MEEAKKLILTESMSEYGKGKTRIPGGVLGIRRPYNFVEGEYPVYFDHGKGGRITDIDGNEYIDYLCAYGPIILGHREEEVDEAVIRQIRDKGFCFSLTQVYQNRLAEIMADLVPSAEMSLFVKTGSDAATCAIRLARSYTQRTKVIRCGYHGWHDWCVEVKGGIPEKLYEDVYEFHYNDLSGLEELLSLHGPETAAVIITPVGHPLAEKVEEPSPGFLAGAKGLTEKYGAVLIFDEIRSGFRVSIGGAQEYYGITPDLSLFGKAMANGYAISAVSGRKEIMKQGEKEVFISSTFFPNSLSHVAALKTIEILRRDKVLDKVWEKGRLLLSLIRDEINKYPVGAELSGIPPMPFITFRKDAKKTYKDRRSLFYTQLIRRGVFLQPFHHGYVCYRHTEKDLRYTAETVGEALALVLERFGPMD